MAGDARTGVGDDGASSSSDPDSRDGDAEELYDGKELESGDDDDQPRASAI